MLFESRETLEEILSLMMDGSDSGKGKQKGKRKKRKKGKGLGPGDDGENAHNSGKNWRKKKGECPFPEEEGGGNGRGSGRGNDGDRKGNGPGKGKGLGPGDDGENAYDNGRNWRKKKGECPFTEMTSAEREKISDKDFIFPKERSWPIHDKKHAKIALTWAGWPQHKDVAAKVKKAVYKKYPDLKEDKALEQLGNIIEEIKGLKEN